VDNGQETFDAVVVGAGPSGLAAAAMIRASGLSVKVLERGIGVATTWRSTYDGVRLNTLRWLSSAPGMRMPREYGRWVRTADYVSYLERYAARHALDVAFNEEATAVSSERGAWHVATTCGRFVAWNLVIATGWCNVPVIPRWPGSSAFTGTLMHSHDYRNPMPFVGRKVLVVGCGNTGTEVAQQLSAAGAETVWISVRTPPNLIPKEFLRVPLHPVALLARLFPPAALDVPARLMQRFVFEDLTPYGMPRAPLGVHAANRRGTYPVIDSGFARAVRSRRILPLPRVVGFDHDAVILGDGTRIMPDAVIAATGYRQNLENLVGHLGVLDASGAPRRSPADRPRGLHFVGFTTKLGGLLFDIGLDARRVARATRRCRRALESSDSTSVLP
jgi:putative flavoprotein involved in K+ transport